MSRPADAGSSFNVSLYSSGTRRLLLPGTLSSPVSLSGLYFFVFFAPSPSSGDWLILFSFPLSCCTSGSLDIEHGGELLLGSAQAISGDAVTKTMILAEGFDVVQVLSLFFSPPVVLCSHRIFHIAVHDRRLLWNSSWEGPPHGVFWY